MQGLAGELLHGALHHLRLAVVPLPSSQDQLTYDDIDIYHTIISYIAILHIGFLYTWPREEVDVADAKARFLKDRHITSGLVGMHRVVAPRVVAHRFVDILAL